MRFNVVKTAGHIALGDLPQGLDFFGVAAVKRLLDDFGAALFGAWVRGAVAGSIGENLLQKRAQPLQFRVLIAEAFLDVGHLLLRCGRGRDGVSIGAEQIGHQAQRRQPRKDRQELTLAALDVSIFLRRGQPSGDRPYDPDQPKNAKEADGPENAEKIHSRPSQSSIRTLPSPARL